MQTPKKEHLKKLQENLYEIPVGFSQDMQVPARVIISEEMLEELFKDRSLWQLVNLTTLPGIVKYAIAMPDIHEGYGAPVGGVCAFEIEKGIISPGICGYDINCGVRLLTSQKTYQEIKNQLAKLTEEIYHQVPSGVGRGGYLKLNLKELDQVLIKGSNWVSEKGFLSNEDNQFIESNGYLKGVDPETVSSTAKKRGLDQLGTLGAGNHFIEIQKVQKIYDEEVAKKLNLFLDQIVIMIHCGSRGLGHQVATDYVKIMLNSLSKYKIKLIDRELACAPFSSPEGTNYFSAMKGSANFAWANRSLITYQIRNAWKKIIDNSPLSILYDVAHNIVKLEKHKIDEEETTLLVHRKGATRAFPPNHPELPSLYKETGQPVIIPGSMGTASFVLVGTSKAMDLSFGSVCHGAGRVMSRREAKRKIRGELLKTELENRGIKIMAGSMAGLAEEAPLAYKNVIEVVEVISNLGLAKKIAKLTPLGVIKG